MKSTVTNTQGIMYLVNNASGRNRSVYEDQFAMHVDPEGIHILGLQMLHNDVEMRTQWYCKMINTDEPAMIWLDVDFDALDKVSMLIEAPQ